MLDGILKKIFGDKNQKDLNELLPIVDLTNEAYEKLHDVAVFLESQGKDLYQTEHSAILGAERNIRRKYGSKSNYYL